jgi:citrate lyase subunit beta/citryl-CoA lyase
MEAPRGGRSYRSMLFVPGHRLDWMLKAVKYGADALIFDLEDSVPLNQKAEARVSVVDAITRLKDASVGRFVRFNGWRTGHLVADVEATLIAGLDGVLLSKTAGPEDVAALDVVLTDLEVARGLPVGRIEISPLAESARSIYLTYEMCMASTRVKRAGLVVNATVGADGARAINLRMSRDGHQWLPFGTHTALAARAAGLSHVMGGMTTVIKDLELVRSITQQSKEYGATGAMAIHPSHVPILNEIYAPSSEEIRDARELVTSMAQGINQGQSAIRHGEGMIDYAHIRSALDLIRVAKSFGMDVGEIPDLDVPSYEPVR